MKERVNYVITESGNYCGNMVNLPIVVQAKSLDELKRRIKIMSQSWVNQMQKTIDQEDFDFVEKPDELTNE